MWRMGRGRTPMDVRRCDEASWSQRLWLVGTTVAAVFVKGQKRGWTFWLALAAHLPPVPVALQPREAESWRNRLVRHSVRECRYRGPRLGHYR